MESSLSTVAAGLSVAHLAAAAVKPGALFRDTVKAWRTSPMN